MKVEELNHRLIPNLREYLERDAASNIYILFNLLSKNERAKFFLAANDRNEVAGVLLVHRGFRKHLGWLVADSQEAVVELSKFIQFRSGNVWTNPEHEKILQEVSESRKAPWKISSKANFEVMKLDRSSLKLEVNHEWRKLSESDALEWAKGAIMMDVEERKGGRKEQEQPDKSLAKEILPTAEDIESARNSLQRMPSFGIFVNGTVAARSAIEVLGDLGVAIRRVFTNPNYRNRGYGISITSVAVQEALKESSSGNILLFVRQDNYSAKKIYDKIGFRSAGIRTEFELEPVTTSETRASPILL